VVEISPIVAAFSLALAEVCWALEFSCCEEADTAAAFSIISRTTSLIWLTIILKASDNFPVSSFEFTVISFVRSPVATTPATFTKFDNGFVILRVIIIAIINPKIIATPPKVTDNIRALSAPLDASSYLIWVRFSLKLFNALIESRHAVCFASPSPIRILVASSILLAIANSTILSFIAIACSSI